MASAVSKAGPYYSSGEIKFSSLRSNFRAQIRKETSGGSETFDTDTTAIKASELLRNTTTSDTNPKVPDATENTNIATSSNWKTSQFRGSIKYYYITQSGTELNFDIDAQSWNSNLNKNIRKFLFVDGTCGSNNATIPAAQLSATAFNLTIDNCGSILGASGRGGGTGSGAPAISGQKGGDALEMTSTSGANNIVLLRNGSRIYAGGGGGEKGRTGDIGSSGSCGTYEYYGVGSGCEWCGSCGSGVQVGGCNGVTGCDCWVWCRKTQLANTQCRRTNYSSVAGGAGGEGGNGGPGRGYNNLEPNSLSGSDGVTGIEGSCSGYDTTSTTPGTGVTGETGARGGEWAVAGQNISNSGTGYVSNTGTNGGAPGRAVFGSNYQVIGTINADIIKGSYNP